MSNIKRGEIYWISASPYRESIGHVQRANRPGIIVSSDNINKGITIHTVVYLTTTPRIQIPTHCIIRSAEQTSTALCEQITTVDETQIGNYIGKVTDEEMVTIENCLRIVLDLDVTEVTITEEPEEEYEDYEQDDVELVKAQHEAKIYKELYEKLLQSVIGAK